MSTASDINEMRTSVLQLNRSINLLSYAAANGTVNLRSFIMLASQLFGSNPTAAKALAEINMIVTAARTAQSVLTALNIQLATTPAGWILIGASVGLSAGFAVYDAMRGT